MKIDTISVPRTNLRFSVSASAMKKIGIDAVRMMIDRTKKGIDIDGIAHSVTSTIVVVSTPNTSITFTQMRFFPGVAYT
mgnify:CR=1 FL=1